MSAGAKGIPLKRVFGSDFPYQESERYLAADFDGVGLRASLAKGGFSNVWGAAMMPYRDEDLAGWPVKAAQLAEHYAAVLKFTGLSARQDGLAEHFPLYCEEARALEPSAQARALLARLDRRRSRLSAAGVHFGLSRLSVQVPQPGRATGCVYCGLCMYGCPYGCIYNSANTLSELQTASRIRYVPNVVVTQLKEGADRVVIEGVDRVDGHPVRLEARRVYVAAGVIPTTQILLRSMGLYDQTVSLKDSQYFLLPLALLRGAGEVRRESLHTLSQVFLEIIHPETSPHTVHLQVYSYNDLIGQAVAKALGPLARPLGFLARALAGRLLIVQGYLHSDHSARIRLALTRDAQGRERLRLTAQPNEETRRRISRVVRKLLRHSPALGAIPLPPLLQVAEPGRGFHSGGSFPMCAAPGPLESDLWGRPKGWNRVHAVDASVLPSIPATTITFSVMANAHRIGWNTALLD
jgi:choline dehydrogenase-like flavoprotein